jgi:hypothetical protein
MVQPMEQWMRQEIDALTTQHGAVPPPWFMYHTHPHSICWRMGGGETHMMVWSTWWPQQQFTEPQKIDYFRKWPPPHCWLAFMIEAIWDVEESSEAQQLAPYFERTRELGFGGQEDYERDLEDPKWLEKEEPL